MTFSDSEDLALNAIWLIMSEFSLDLFLGKHSWVLSKHSWFSIGGPSVNIAGLA